MEDDLDPGPETHPKPLRLNAREQKLFAYLLRLTILVGVLMLAKWLL